MSQQEPSLGPGLTSFPAIARIATRGNRLATIVSAFAFAFSAVSFYETVLKMPKLIAHVAPVIQYARDGGGEIELFAVPVTLVNEGARTGTVLSMTLDVTDAGSGRVKSYYAAFFGDHPQKTDTTNRSFAPLSIIGRSTFSDTIRFYPKGNPLPRLIDDRGDFRFRLTLVTADPGGPRAISWLLGAEPQPLLFERTLPWLSEQSLSLRRLTISMHDKSWNPPEDKSGPGGEEPPSGGSAAPK